MFYQMRQEMEDEDDDMSDSDNFPQMSFSSILESMEPEQAMAIKAQMGTMTEE